MSTQRDPYLNVIPASEARRESFLKKDSGQAGMTDLIPRSLLRGSSLITHIILYQQTYTHQKPGGVRQIYE